jgi:3-dehydroquinate dehydratase/shikimate dehydrogenase
MAKICVPVCVRRVEELAGAVDLASSVGDLVELRLDYLKDPEAAIATVIDLADQSAAQIIVTMRGVDQGGAGSHGLEVRRHFWSRAKDLPKVLLDIEFDLLTRMEESSLDWNRVICSYHDFRGGPSDIDRLYARMASTPARILKIALQADDATDCLPIFRLLERAQDERRKLIALAMGEAGIVTRILGPSRGSFLTYGSLDAESGTAPGQITAKDLREIYRIDQFNRETQIFGIVGNPVAHSLSPQIHNAAFAAANLNAVYIPFQVNDANNFMHRMVQPRSREIEWNLRGLSVTAPHKLTVMNRLDWIEPAAKEICAVNTIVVRDDELHGYNTDMTGFISPLRAVFGSLKEARCAVIGAGGAARAALCALAHDGAKVELFARDPSRAAYIAHQFHAKCHSMNHATFHQFDIAINATPLGTRGEHEAETPVVAEQLRGVRLAYDLVYNPTETRFIAEAREAGCETLGGIEMLLTQAIEQFKLWTGREPDLAAIRAAAMKRLVQAPLINS